LLIFSYIAWKRMRKALLFILFIFNTLLVESQVSLGYNAYYYYPGGTGWNEDFTGGDGCNNGKAIFLYGVLGWGGYPSANYNYIIKTDTNGKYLWSKYIGPAFSPISHNDYQGVGKINPDTWDSTTTNPYGMLIASTDDYYNYNFEYPCRANFTQIDSGGNVKLSIDFYSKYISSYTDAYPQSPNHAAGCVAKSTSVGNFYFMGSIYNDADSTSCCGYETPPSSYLGGYFVQDGGAGYLPNSDMFIAKINKSATNDTVFTKTIGLVYTYNTYPGEPTWYFDSTRNDVPQDFYYDKASNGLYIVGFTNSNYNGGDDIDGNYYIRSQMFVMKTDTLGNPKWVNTIYYGSGVDNAYESGIGGGFEMGSSITQVPGSTDYMVVGEMGNNGYPEEGGIILSRITNTGTVSWVHQINFGGSGWGYSISPSTDGNLIIGAWTGDAASGGSINEVLFEVNTAGNYVAGTGVSIGTPGIVNGSDQNLWYGPRAFQIGTGSYGIVCETLEPNSTYGGAMVTKLQRSGANAYKINSPCTVTAAVTPTVSDISPASGASIKAQIRSWNGVISGTNDGLNPRVGGKYYGFSVPIEVSILNPNTNAIVTNIGSGTTSTISCALPIALVSFTGEYNATADCTNLQWSTATETDNHYFFIERSTDGEHWQTIDTVAGAGNSDQMRYYTSVDHHPLAGINYYSLVQEDYNGHRQSFNTVSVNVPASKTITLYPNPASTNITIEGVNLQSAIIYTAMGQKMWSGNTVDKTNIDISSFSDGVYLVQAIDKVGNITMLRFTKQTHQ